MGDVSAFRWDVDDLERSESEEAPAPPRAKPVVRRAMVAWLEAEGAFRTTIGRFSVCVAKAPGARRWEWIAFSQGKVPRALRCKGFVASDEAQRDAEVTLSEIA
jgi:hypothetical protein